MVYSIMVAINRQNRPDTSCELSLSDSCLSGWIDVKGRPLEMLPGAERIMSPTIEQIAKYDVLISESGFP